MRSIITTLIYLMYAFSSKAQQNFTQKIKGIIIDSESKKPLEGASITIENLNKAAISNSIGYFEVKLVPIGRHNLIAEFNR